MRHNRTTVLVPALALVLALAAGAWAECAPYISTGFGEKPGVGTLIGTETRTDVYYELSEVSSSGILGRLTGGVKRTIYKQVSRTYEVGTYMMSDGSRVKVNCSDYTYI